MTADQRKATISQYHAAGIKLIVSAFGDQDKKVRQTPAVDAANNIAKWVTAYGVDGVDVNYEVCFVVESSNSH